MHKQHNQSTADASSDMEKAQEEYKETVNVDRKYFVEAAADGHAATDQYGHALVEVDCKAEAALVRKLDMWIVPILGLCYLFCYIDRANIGNARVAGFEADIGLKPSMYRGYGFNLLLTAFYIPYIVCEPFGAFTAKLVGPGRYLPASVVLFGLFSFAMTFIHSFSAAFALRFLLGLSEAGVFPATAYYLSRFYRKDEFGLRMASFIVGAPLAGGVGGLLASAFLAAPGFGMVRSWRILFFGEGLITIGLGIVAWVLLPNSPESCRFLSAKERALAVTRIKSENVGSTELLDSVHSKVVQNAMFNPTTLCMAAHFCFANIPVQGLGFFLPSILRAIYPGISLVKLQLRTVPVYVVGSFALLLLSYLGSKTSRRALYMIIAMPFLMAGYALFLGSNAGEARYAACFLIALGSSPTGPLSTSWATINTTSDTARAATLSFVIFWGNVGGLIATWTYIPKLASAIPRKSQIPGNALNLAGAFVQLALTVGLWMWQRKENQRKAQGRDDKNLEGLSAGEVAMLGQRHPAYRYRH